MPEDGGKVSDASITRMLIDAIFTQFVMSHGLITSPSCGCRPESVSGFVQTSLRLACRRR